MVMEVRLPAAVKHATVSRDSVLLPWEHEVSDWGATDRRRINLGARRYVKKRPSLTGLPAQSFHGRGWKSASMAIWTAEGCGGGELPDLVGTGRSRR